MKRKKVLMESMGPVETHCVERAPAIQLLLIEKELPLVRDVIKKYIASKGEWTDVSKELLLEWHETDAEFKRNQGYYKGSMKREGSVDLNEIYSNVSEVNKKIAKWIDDTRFLMRYGMSKTEQRKEVDDLKKMFSDYFKGTFDTSKYR
jgi:hypothetical protein